MTDLERLNKEYTAEDGLIDLRPEQRREPYEGQNKTTAGNDNGILFRAYAVYLLFKRGGLTSQYEQDSLESIERLRDEVSGLTHRNPGRTGDKNSHDNLIGELFIASFNEAGDEYIEFIHEYGAHNGWRYNNTGKREHERRSEIQPKDITLIKILYGIEPNKYHYAVFLLAILFNAFQSPMRTSEHMMTALRIEMAELYDYDLSPLYKILLTITSSIWRYALHIKTKGRGLEQIYETYFKPSDHRHPLIGLAKGVKW